MSDEGTKDEVRIDGVKAESAKTDSEGNFKPITSQEEFNKALDARLNRERAKYAGYDDLKAKAAEFDKLQEASKSEAQKLQERAEAAERRALEAETRSMRSEIAREKGVPASSLRGSTREEMEASADELIKWRDEHAPKRRTPSNLKSGASGSGDALTGKEAAAAALRQLRSN